MTKLKVKNVGPIKRGYLPNNGFMSITNLSVFIGDQGAGKSTIAKIYSTLTWIEKALVRGDFTPNHLTQYNRFKKKLDYQNIGNYLSEDSIIEYIGKAYRIFFRNDKLEIELINNDINYKFPKIMYVPAERNFVSSVERPDLIKRLPLPLYTFLDEYEQAKKNFTNTIDLPIGNLKFEYRKQNKKSILVGSDYKIELLEASSGFQSFVPLFLVTKNLERVIKWSDNLTHRSVSVSEEKKIRKEIDDIFKNDNISEDVRRVLLEKLSSRFKYACFINIVEEPEQNLYPLSQKEVLFNLINTKNKDVNNQLIITTHSPYIINYLTLSIKGFLIKEKTDNEKLLNKLNDIVPLDATVSPDIVSIFQLNIKGEVKKLDTYKGLPSDENFLNEFLAESNELFIELMKIEDLCQ